MVTVMAIVLGSFLFAKIVEMAYHSVFEIKDEEVMR